MGLWKDPHCPLPEKEIGWEVTNICVMTYDCPSNHEEPKSKLENTNYDFYSNFVPLNFILRKRITNLLLKEGYKHSFRRI